MGKRGDGKIKAPEKFLPGTPVSDEEGWEKGWELGHHVGRGCVKVIGKGTRGGRLLNEG